MLATSAANAHIDAAPCDSNTYGGTYSHVSPNSHGGADGYGDTHGGADPHTRAYT